MSDQNIANTALCTVLHCSSASPGCEIDNILDDDPALLWLSAAGDGLPQYFVLKFTPTAGKK